MLLKEFAVCWPRPSACLPTLACQASKAVSTLLPRPADPQLSSPTGAQTGLPQGHPGIRNGRNHSIAEGPGSLTFVGSVLPVPPGERSVLLAPCSERTGHRQQQGAEAAGQWLPKASQVRVTGPRTRRPDAPALSRSEAKIARAGRQPPGSPHSALCPRVGGIWSLGSPPWGHMDPGRAGQGQVADTRNRWPNCPLPWWAGGNQQSSARASWRLGLC